MAFTNKLTDTIRETCDIARADGASLYTFILKHDGIDAQSFATNANHSFLFCALATVVSEIEEKTGLSRKKIFMILDKTMKEAGPLRREDIGD